MEDGSDDEEIVEQSLMQLQMSATAEETEDDTDHTLIDLHLLVIQPTGLKDTDVIMEEDESLLANQILDPFDSNIQPTSATDVSNDSQSSITQPTSVTDVFHLGEESTLFEVIEQASNDFSASQPSAFDQDRSLSTVPIKGLEEPTIKKEMSSESFLPLPSAVMPEIPVMTTAPFPNGPVLLDGILYQPFPAPHNLMVVQSNFPAPTVVPCTPAAEPAVPTLTAVSAPPATEPIVPALTAVSAPPAAEPVVPAPAMPIEPKKPRVGLFWKQPTNSQLKPRPS